MTWNVMEAVPVPAANTTVAWQGYADALNTTLSQTWPDIALNFSGPLMDIVESSGDPNTVNLTFLSILGTVSVYVATGFEVDVGGDGGAIESQADYLVEVVFLYSTVYLYFFISAGLVLIILAIIFMLGKKSKTRVEYVSIGVRLVVGLGLVLLATIYAPFGDPFFNYFQSPWLTPTVVLAYALVVGLDIVLIFLSRMMVARRPSVASSAV